MTAGATKLHTYLNFAGNAEEAFGFYRSVFGGEFSSLVRFRDMPMQGVAIPPEEQDGIMHISLPIGDDEVLMASDTLPSLGHRLVQGNNVYISVHATTRDEADRIFTALSDGGDVEMPISDQPWGDYFGSFTDRYGVKWMVSHSPQQPG